MNVFNLKKINLTMKNETEKKRIVNIKIEEEKRMNTR